MPFDSDVFFRIKRRWKEGNIYEYEKQINYSMPHSQSELLIISVLLFPAIAEVYSNRATAYYRLGKILTW